VDLLYRPSHEVMDDSEVSPSRCVNPPPARRRALPGDG